MGRNEWSDAYDELIKELGRKPSQAEVECRVVDNKADRINKLRRSAAEAEYERERREENDA